MRTTLILAAAILVVGCTPKTQINSNNPDAIDIITPQGEAVVQEIHLKDGTRCVTLVGNYKGSITCDWGNQ